MTLSVIIKNANFTKTVGQLGLVHDPKTYHIFGVSEAESIKSQLYGGSAATVTGALTYNSDSVTIPNVSTSGIVTNQSYYGGAGNYTMFGVFKVPSTAAVIVGADHNSSNSGDSGHGLQLVSGNIGLKTNAGAKFAIAPNQGTGFAFAAVRADKASGQIAIDYYGLSGRVKASEVMVGFGVGVARNFRAGVINTGGAILTIAAMGNYHRYLTDDEVNDVYRQVKDDLQRLRGVIIP